MDVPGTSPAVEQSGALTTPQALAQGPEGAGSGGHPGPRGGCALLTSQPALWRLHPSPACWLSEPSSPGTVGEGRVMPLSKETPLFGI